MNKFLLFIFSISVVTTLFSCKENSITAKQYHDEVYASVDTVVKYVFVLDNDLRSKSKESKASYKRLLELTNENIQFVEEKGSFESKDKKMQTASLEILTYYKNYSEKNFKQAVDIVQKDTISELEENQVLDIINEFYDGESKYLDVFKKESYDFGDRYKIYKAQTSKKN